MERAESEEHLCDPDRLVSFQLFAMRAEISQFDRQLTGYLDTAGGRFEQWMAARTVRGWA